MRIKQQMDLGIHWAVKPVSAVARSGDKPRDPDQHARGKHVRTSYYTGSWISARRSGECRKCGGDIMLGDTVKWIPCSKRLLCYSCGQHEGQAILGFVRGILV